MYAASRKGVIGPPQTVIVCLDLLPPYSYVEDHEANENILVTTGYLINESLHEFGFVGRSGPVDGGVGYKMRNSSFNSSAPTGWWLLFSDRLDHQSATDVMRENL